MNTILHYMHTPHSIGIDRRLNNNTRRTHNLYANSAVDIGTINGIISHLPVSPLVQR